MSNIYIVDIQYFRGNNKVIILKSFAYAKLYDNVVEHFIFKPPYDFNELSLVRKYEARHVMKNYHKLTWDEGYVDYSYVPKILRSILSDADEVLVKGQEKVQYINHILQRSVGFNVEYLDCPKLSALKMAHSFFDTTPVSTQNVRAIMHWISMLFCKSTEFIDEALNKYNMAGMFSLSQKERYFLPVSFLVDKCSPSLLEHEIQNLAPHIVNSKQFRNFVFIQQGRDEVWMGRDRDFEDAQLETQLD